MAYRPASARPTAWPGIHAAALRSLLPHLVAVLAGLLCAGEAAAQFTQYAAPGGTAGASESLRQQLESGAANARWRLGALRLDPQIFVRDVGYQSNVFAAAGNEEEVADYRALVAAGLNGYLPLGRKAMLSAFVTPEYSWWAELEQLRELSLSSGVGFFGFFNRLTVAADGRRVEQEQRLNLELPAPVQVEEERISLALELELRRSLFLVASAQAADFRHAGAAESAIDGLDLGALDRDFESRRLGVRLRLGDEWTLGGGVEETENSFLQDPVLRSHTGTSPYAELAFEGTRLSARLDVSGTELEFGPGSPLTAFDARTGAARVAWRRPQRFSVALYARRNVVFSARETDSLFIDQRWGLSAEREPGPRFTWLVFAERGDLDYSRADAARGSDELTAWGADLDFAVARSLRLILTFSRGELRSDEPGLDRSTSAVGVRLSIHRNLFPF